MIALPKYFDTYLIIIGLCILVAFLYIIVKIVTELSKTNCYSVKRLERERQLRKSTKNENGSKAYTFKWKVENFNYCWLKTGEYVESPTFVAHSLDGTKWSLRLFPKGKTDGKSVDVYLHREKDGYGPKSIQVKYQLAFLDDSRLISEIEAFGEFQRDTICSTPIMQGKISDPERKIFFPGNTMTIQCKIRMETEETLETERLNARTIFQVQYGTFVWKIDKLSTLPSGLIRNFVVRDETKNDLINFDLFLTRASEFYIDIRPCNDCIKFCSFKVSIKDYKGKAENYFISESYDGYRKEGIFSRIEIKPLPWENYLHLENDALSLNCNYAFSSGTIFSECAIGGTISSKVNVKDNKLIKDLQDDLKSMYSNAILCDVELCTPVLRFPAHKSILSARSTVFRRMFHSDMKEKNSGYVKITDLDEKTVHQMLMYMYTDSLEGVQLESAIKLYKAAEKYDILSLKRKCSSYFEANFSPVTVCEVLILADTYQDDDLRNAIQEYVAEHDKAVFNSKEWKHFMEKNVQLAADVMYRSFTKSKM